MRRLVCVLTLIFLTHGGASAERAQLAERETLVSGRRSLVIYEEL